MHPGIRARAQNPFQLEFAESGRFWSSRKQIPRRHLKPLFLFLCFFSSPSLSGHFWASWNCNRLGNTGKWIWRAPFREKAEGRISDCRDHVWSEMNNRKCKWGFLLCSTPLYFRQRKNFLSLLDIKPRKFQLPLTLSATLKWKRLCHEKWLTRTLVPANQNRLHDV